MTSSEIEDRLAEAGIVLPEAPAVAGSYVPYVHAQSLLFVSGQLPIADGACQYIGLLGRDVDLEDGVAAARLCAINVLAQVRQACDGDLGRIVRCVRLGGFVASTSDFEQHPTVINGASDLMAEALGEEAGAHARAAVGVAALPLGASVEVEAVFEISAE